MTSLLYRCTKNLFVQRLIDGPLDFIGGAALCLCCDKKSSVIVVWGL